ncbi:MAG TPA: membrane protein insertase YidC [Thermoanaerobaculia bacterium]|jgi:YidC/Oxa1 family membrane protein insertase|nr:membrane protein insertase YidC [Thermoanaerobaculia bacterium]
MRRFLLFIVLTVAIMATWTYFFPPPKPAPRPAAVPEASGTPGTTAGTQALPGESPGTAQGQGQGPGQLARPAASLPAWAGQPVQAAGERQVVLEDARTRAVFTNRGAQLVSLQLKNQKTHQGGAVELVRKRAEGPYPYGLVRDKGLGPHPLGQALFRVESGRDGSLVFRYRGPAGVAEKRFRFDDQGFLESVINVPGGGWALSLGPGLGNPTAEEMGSRYGRRGAVYKHGGDVEVLNAQREDEVKTVSGRLDWIGLEDTYFLSALIPRAGLDEVVIQPLMTEGSAAKARFLPLPGKDDITSDQKKLPREFRVVLEPKGDSLSLLSYWGDKNYDRLASLPYDLEGAVKLGTFAFLARPLLVALHWIHDNVVANYGWAIILLTIVIKILLLPLTHTNMKSMKRMQELNPRVQSIREKYRSKLKDKQGRPNLEVQRKMNDEVMAVYKEAGVNPVGGCLPMLLQMPILFAFFNLLTAAVELRNAPWMLWVLDLSSKDPYYVLPIVMGATQWFQVRMAPQSGDPMQRRMFELMPIIMTVMFIGVPSGLVLYWLTNNVLTILQQAVYKRLEKRKA